MIVKGSHHHLIVSSQLIHKRDRRVLNLFHAKADRAAGIKHQRHGEGLLGRSKVSDLLFDTIFPNAKIFFAQIRNVLTVTIHYADRNADQRRIDAHHIAGADFFGTCILLLG